MSTVIAVLVVLNFIFILIGGYALYRLTNVVDALRTAHNMLAIVVFGRMAGDADEQDEDEHKGSEWN